MASKLKSAAAADARSTAKLEEKKAPVKREDPIARAERLLEEARQRVKAQAEQQLGNAEAAMELSKKSLAKAERIHAERLARVIKLRNALGLSTDDLELDKPADDEYIETPMIGEDDAAAEDQAA